GTAIGWHNVHWCSIKITRQGQCGRTCGPVEPVGKLPSPSVGRSALRMMGCNSDPRIETFGASSWVNCEAPAGPATVRLQSSVRFVTSTSPAPEMLPCGVRILKDWHQI